jgi:hypothetical protein
MQIFTPSVIDGTKTDNDEEREKKKKINSSSIRAWQRNHAHQRQIT